ncbi:MAG TPA: AgmX/PglI C-terminal domain-containing protein [Myxococcales bacterium]|nr:AgmX/PglI C-terminal domain-containing protein [Myxococcales bacterium]
MANETNTWIAKGSPGPSGAATALRIEPPAGPREGDAAAAKLLVFDELPEDERPRKGDRVLLLGLVWGGTTLIELEQIARGGELKVGKLFDLPAVRLPPGFRLVRPESGELVFTVPAALKSEVRAGGRVWSLEQLAFQGKARRVDAPFRGHAYPVRDGDRVVVQVAPSLQLIARYTRAARAGGKGFFRSIDAGFAGTLLVALAALGLFWFSLRNAPHARVQPLSDELLRGRARIAKFQPRPPEPARDPPAPKDAAGAKEGAKAAADEGKLGKPDEKKKQAAPSRKGVPRLDPHKAEKDRKVVLKRGLLAALGKLGAGAGGAGASVLGPDGLGSGINHALGGVKARAGPGDAWGVGGLGSRGGGAGGGGRALGIGGLGTRGGGRGRGGYGDVDLGGRGKEETQFIPGRTVVVGGLSREVIDRIIQRHYNEIKYCYEKELSRDPSLHGKVTVLFVVDGAGSVADALVQQTTLSSESVEGCIVSHVRRWAFPAPDGGGTVQVTYPYVFKSNGQ